MYRKKAPMSRGLYITLIVVLTAVFLVSGAYVLNYFTESREQAEQYDDLASIVESIQAQTPTETVKPTQSTAETESTEQEPTETEPTEETTEPVELINGMLPEYAALYEMNSDIVGWMKIDGTKVNYPVMQTPDSIDYYLHRNFQKQDSAQGALYAREVCDINAPSDNITIYGHNMRDGSMFACLSNYQKQSYWEDHDTIIFDTLSERHTYRIFAVFKTTASAGEGFAYHQFVDAADEEEFNAFVATCKELAFFDTGLTPVYGDKMITLSTCEYTQTNGRFVVVAYRVS